MSQTKLEVLVAFSGGAAVSGLQMLRQNTDQLKASLEKIRLNQRLAADLLSAKARFNEISKSGHYSKEAVRAVTAEVAALSAKARDAGLNIGKLHSELRSLKMQQVGLQLQTSGQGLRERGQQMRADAKSKAMEAAAAGYALYKPLSIAAKYEDVVKDIAITGDMTRKEEAELAKSIRGLAVRYNQEQVAVADSMKKLVETGMEKSKAEATTPLLAKTATATRTDTGDAAKMARSFELLEVGDMELAFNQAAKGGKSGSFELTNMAKWFPELGGYMKELGVKGNEAVVSMSARMQIATRTAGGNDEAANNLKNFLSKLTSQDTAKDFKKQGVDLIPALQAAARQGMDPIAAGVDLVMKHVATKAPEAAKELKKVAEEVAAIKDPVERQAELERRQGMIRKLGDRAGLGELFQDMQAVSYLLAEMQNQDELKQLLADVKTGTNADGRAVIDADFERRTEGMSEKLKGLKIAGTELGIAFGNALMPVVDMMIPMASGLATMLTKFTENHPSLSRLAVVALTGASAMSVLGFAAKFALGGLLTSVGNVMTVVGWLMRLRQDAQIAGLLSQFGTVAARVGGVLGGALVKGLTLAGRAIFIMGRALLMNPIGLAVTGIAVAAFLIYKNWDKIGPWFAKAWDAVKTTFQTAWTWFKGLPGQFLQMGQDLINGLVNGITSRIGAVAEAVSKVASTAKDSFKNWLGIKSPSRVFMGYGVNIGEGAAVGIRQSISPVRAAIGAMSAATALTFAPSPVLAQPAAPKPVQITYSTPTTAIQLLDATAAVRGQWALPQIPQQALQLLPALARLPVIGPMLQPLLPRMASMATPQVPDATAAVRGQWALPQIPQQALQLLPALARLPVIGPMLQPLLPRMAPMATPQVPDATAAARGQWTLPQIPQQALQLPAALATAPQPPSRLEQLLRSAHAVASTPTAPGQAAAGNITVHYAPSITIQDQGNAQATGTAVQTALITNQRDLERMLQRILEERERRSIR